MKTFIPHIPTSGRFDYLETLGIITAIEFALAGNEGYYSLSVKGAIHRQTPANEIIKMVKDTIEDNQTLMDDLLGVKLVARIKAYDLPDLQPYT